MSPLVEQIDVYPTLADLAGLPIPEHTQGHSLVPILNNHEHTVREAAYTLRSKSHLLRTDRWAYIQYARNGGEELYDMQKDPKQFKNLVQDPEFKNIHQKLKAQLDQKLAEINR